MPCQNDRPELDHLLDQLGDLAGTRALLLGEPAEGGVDTLIVHGCHSAAEVPPGSEPEEKAADLVVLPLVRSAASAAALICQARRALIPGGRIALRLMDRRFGRLLVACSVLLRRQGFANAGLRAVPPEILITAQLQPAPPPRRLPFQITWNR